MHIRRALALLTVISFLSACNLSRPEVMLTLAPVDTRKPDATAVRELPTATTAAKASATPSTTATPTATNTDLPTASPLPTDKPTDTVQPSPTRIVFETDTPTVKPSATDRFPARLPQNAEAATASATSTEAPESQNSARQTFTPLPTLNQTEVAKLLATPLRRPTLPSTWTAVPTLPSTWTAVPSLPPTNTIVAPPWATAPVDIAAPTIDRVQVLAPRLQLGAPPSTPTPSPTRFQPTVAVRRDLLQPPVQAPISQPTTLSISGAPAYQYNVAPGQVFSFQNIQLQGGVRLFLQNPVDAGSFLRTDYKGMLHYKPVGGQERELTYSPFHQGFAGGISSIDENKNRIVEVDWSADGSRFSFRVDPPPGADNSSAGVWFWQPETNLETDPTYAIIRDCAAPGYSPCNIVNPSGAPYWRTIAVQWSPIQGDNTVLLTLRLPGEGRNALANARAVRDPLYANDAPPFVRYDYGSWNPDGQGITVSGRRPDGRVIIGVVNRNLDAASERVILDGSARGLWLRDAVLSDNGEIAAFGRPGAPGSGPVALYDQYGSQLSEFIGGGPPEDIRWFPDRSAAVVTAGGQQYTVEADSGVIVNVTGLASNPQFSAGTDARAPIPAAVIVNAEYGAGEQLRVSVPYLNIRQAPSTSSGVVGGLQTGDYVAIFAGPYDNEGYRWWQVQTANGAFGWVAGAINGAPTLRRP